MLTFYGYDKCGTCQKALKWLAAQGLEVDKRAIRDTPPSMEELRFVLGKVGDSRKLFNTSGQTYRQLGLKDLLGNLSDEERLEMLNSEGNLVKRPFLLDEKRGVGLVGFKEDVWADALL